MADMEQEHTQPEAPANTQNLVDLGTSLIQREEGRVYVLTIVGQIEGHQLLPSGMKSTKYEHVLPLLAAVEGDPDIHGLLILLGVGPDDTPELCEKLADKALGLRIFCDEAGKMNRSLADIGGQVLVVSQFTLYADCRKGKRPSFTGAALPELAVPLYEQFLQECRSRGFEPQHGRFGADMLVASENDGPVTILLDTDELLQPRRG